MRIPMRRTKGEGKVCTDGLNYSGLIDGFAQRAGLTLGTNEERYRAGQDTIQHVVSIV